MRERTYIAIDLKSFYASVECITRGLDPLTTNLVVADQSRTDKTICLAVTPSLKAYGISGRCRLFEVVQKVREVNALRKSRAPGRQLTGASSDDSRVKTDPSLALDYIVATPRMATYMEWSSRVFQIYLRYFAPEDIHSYSIDEVFIDATDYLQTYGLSPRDLTMKVILDVLEATGITATAGIGTNLYLCKVAMDIVAKHIPPDKNGVRIAELDEMTYRRTLWDHTPITDFWRVGRGYARRLETCGFFTMGDIAMCTARGGEDILYDMFGVNAELLIDHAWGWEPCTMADIKAYKPENTSIGSGQVLHCPYTWEKARLIVKEMTDALVLDLVSKGLMTNQLTLTVGYDIDNVTKGHYTGEIKVDHYGRQIPKHGHGTANLEEYTSSTRLIMEAAMDLYDRITNKKLLVRRLNLTANRVLTEEDAVKADPPQQLDLFTDYEAKEREKKELERERRLQSAMVEIKQKFGKNAILKANNLEEGATARDRNRQVGGHKA